MLLIWNAKIRQTKLFFWVKKGDSPGIANIVHTPEPELHNKLCVLNLFCILATRIDILYVINWLNWGFGLLPSQKNPSVQWKLYGLLKHDDDVSVPPE